MLLLQLLANPAVLNILLLALLVVQPQQLQLVRRDMAKLPGWRH
jgi:hypothetical protein